MGIAEIVKTGSLLKGQLGFLSGYKTAALGLLGTSKATNRTLRLPSRGVQMSHVAHLEEQGTKKLLITGLISLCMVSPTGLA